jgi:hypothetical protein
VLIETTAQPFRKLRTTNSTDASYPTRTPTNTAPSGIGDAAAQTTSAVIDLTAAQPKDGPSQNTVLLVPFGVGSDTNTFKMRVIGWRVAYERAAEENPLTALWVPVILGEFTCTLSTPTGATGTIISTSNRFCDTITIVGTSANDDVSVDIVSPANDTIAHVALTLKGSQKLEVTFDLNSSATSANTLFARY